MLVYRNGVYYIDSLQEAVDAQGDDKADDSDEIYISIPDDKWDEFANDFSVQVYNNKADYRKNSLIISALLAFLGGVATYFISGHALKPIREFSEKIEIGVMIETPAAAVISDKLAPLVDFFSVGTNDLTQYTLACDRQNPQVEQFCDTHHEAILRLIELSAKNAHASGKWIGICGELAADTSLTETFLRMGIDELSVSPAFVLPLRDKVRKTDLRK